MTVASRVQIHEQNVGRLGVADILRIVEDGPVTISCKFVFGLRDAGRFTSCPLRRKRARSRINCRLAEDQATGTAQTRVGRRLSRDNAILFCMRNTITCVLKLMLRI